MQQAGNLRHATNVHKLIRPLNLLVAEQLAQLLNLANLDVLGLCYLLEILHEIARQLRAVARLKQSLGREWQSFRRPGAQMEEKASVEAGPL
jgi:hypothetical protein